jgi:hypothetical protein
LIEQSWRSRSCDGSNGAPASCFGRGVLFLSGARFYFYAKNPAGLFTIADASTTRRQLMFRTGIVHQF